MTYLLRVVLIVDGGPNQSALDLPTCLSYDASMPCWAGCGLLGLCFRH